MWFWAFRALFNPSLHINNNHKHICFLHEQNQIKQKSPREFKPSCLTSDTPLTVYFTLLNNIPISTSRHPKVSLYCWKTATHLVSYSNNESLLYISYICVCVYVCMCIYIYISQDFTRFWGKSLKWRHVVLKVWQDTSDCVLQLSDI